MWQLKKTFHFAENMIQYLAKSKFTKEGITLELSNISDNILLRHITNIISHLGVPDHFKGYYYIRTAILLCVRDMAAATDAFSLIYPTIAKQFRTTEPNVKRDMRSAIEVTWHHGNAEAIEKMFGYSITSGRPKPTNSEFIARIADKIRLDVKGYMM